MHNFIAYIEYARGGHVGGENNKNIFAWELNFFPKENSFIVLLLQHGRRAHTLLYPLTKELFSIAYDLQNFYISASSPQKILS